jgi:hypothetical protein
MTVNASKLPTHIALVARRVNLCHVDDLANLFLETSYLAEVAIKTLGIALCAGLRQPAREVAYRHTYELVRADGLGTWETTIRDITTQPTAAYLPPEFFKVLAWVTKKRTKPEDEWFREALGQARLVLGELGGEESDPGKLAGTVKDLLSALVQIRNKTKAHGAVGQNFYERANDAYLDAVRAIVELCPAFLLRWIHLSKRESGKIRAVLLQGLEPRHMRDAEGALFSVGNPGIYIASDQSPKSYYCGDLLRSDREYRAFTLPNGGVTQSGEAEFIDYASGKTAKESITAFLAPPAPLPPSETEGMSAFDVQSNAFGNLPTTPPGYVRRKALEEELMARLRDRNHPIITLHGGGGMGKTTLAIFVAHEIARLEDPPFEHIVWFSARDIDLRLRGPASVRPSVVDIESVAEKMGELFSPYGTSGDVETFARLLESASDISHKGILFVFDNFETISDARSLHQFLDQHTHLPNKVVITSRERAIPNGISEYKAKARISSSRVQFSP